MTPTSLPHAHAFDIACPPEHMPALESFAGAAEIFHLLGDPTRLRLFWLLCHGEECLINLSAITKMSSPALSHHLKLLKETGLVTARRSGKEVFYRAKDSNAAHLLHGIIEQIACVACLRT